MHQPGVRAASAALIEELMAAVVSVDFVLVSLMDLPEDVLPGENRAEAIREMLSASACREVEGVGEEVCRAAIALIGKVIDRIADDAHAAAEMAEAAGQRPC
jgi:hypothetical protein